MTNGIISDVEGIECPQCKKDAVHYTIFLGENETVSNWQSEIYCNCGYFNMEFYEITKEGANCKT